MNMNAVISMVRFRDVAVLLLMYISVVYAYNQTVCKPEQYPNPMTTPEKCGATEPSYFCDPDGFLSKEKGQLLCAPWLLKGASHTTYTPFQFQSVCDLCLRSMLSNL